jgi:glycerate 2-kinase
MAHHRASIRFDPSVLAADPSRRGQILSILEAALRAVDPGEALRRSLRRQGNELVANDTHYSLDFFRRVFVIGFGKAAAPMGQAAAEILGDRLTAGVLVTKIGHGRTHTGLPQGLTLLEAAHPLPDAAGVAAARRIADLARQATADDLILCLISGGGSALLPLPAGSLTLADLQATTAALLRCGATIDEINTLRKHLSQVAGGQMARLAAPATMLSLVLSDVVGSPLDVIASGPTVPDRSSWADAWAVVERHGVQAALPDGVVERLRAGLAGQLADTPKPGDPAFASTQTLVIGDNAIAAQAAQQRAAELGFNARVLTTFLEGEAREVAKVAVALGREIVAHSRPIAAPACLILGGETTVTLRGQGKGGRNQELALAAALMLDRLPEKQQVVVVSLASDGTDGPTNSAGGMVDGTSVDRGRAIGLDAGRHLADNNSNPYLAAVGDLLVTGPTLTNVNDLVFVFVWPEDVGQIANLPRP